ncbi:MAG: hypothetical protein ARM1_0002 [Candidatus Micrarchaeota archaeon]|nr:MAG: hypothetical protein ARM1_0002 [Candidatus Micrarchaeota archaeon]
MDNSKIIKYIARALYFVLLAIFLIYFIIYNNDQFMLYSIIIFLLLVIPMLLLEKVKRVSAILSFITLSTTVVYGLFNKLSIIIFTLMSFISISVMLSYDKLNKYYMYIFWLFILPLIYYILNLPANILENIAILGYYLLISVTIASLIEVISDCKISKNRLLIRLSRFINKNINRIYAISIIAAIVIILLPIYPIKPIIDINKLAYLTSNTTQLNPGLYYIVINSTMLHNITSIYANTSILVYANNGPIKIYTNKSLNLDNRSNYLIFNLTKKTNNLRIYIVPNYSNSNITVNQTIFSRLFKNSSELRLNNRIYNVYGYYTIKETIREARYINNTINYRYKYNISRSYQPGLICRSYNNGTYKVNISIEGNATVLFFYNISNYTKYLQSLALENNLNNSLKVLASYIVNSTSQIKITRDTGCIYYIILGKGSKVEINEEEEYRYLAYINKNISVSIPYQYKNYSNLVSESSYIYKGLSYIINLYANESGIKV